MSKIWNETDSRFSLCHLRTGISDILVQVDELSRKSQEIDTTGQFEWVDSVLVRALKYGHWLLISNANFCRYVYGSEAVVNVLLCTTTYPVIQPLCAGPSQSTLGAQWGA